MEDHSSEFSIVKMSKVLGVSRSGYYRWRGRGPSAREKQNTRLKQQIRQIWKASNKVYGSPRIHRQLAADGEQLSRPRVARLMAQMGIQSEIRPKWVATTDSGHALPVAPNLLDRNFAPKHLGQVWVSDITYLASTDGWLYLTTIMDLADRQIIGWSLSRGLSADQTSIPAWKAARQVTQSMSRKGNCWDNAPAESFFKTLKAELPVDTSGCTYQHIRRALFQFIEIWYNRQRLHSSLDYRTPAQTEELLTTQNQQAA